MAEADGSAEGHQTKFLDDAAKEVLVERYLDLVFVDDVKELSCKRCGRVHIHHYVANCGHLFCRNCQRILSNGEGWRCPECKEYITNIERQEVEVERRVNELMSHCPNHKYGCKIIAKLQHILEHLKKCLETRDANLPAYYYELNSKFDIHQIISDISNQLAQLSAQYTEIQQLRANDVRVQEQIKSKLDDVETIVRGSTVATARLQAEVADNSSRVTEIEREVKQLSQHLSTQLIEQYNEIQQLRVTDVNAQEQIKIKLDDVENVVKESTEVTTRLQTEVADNSSKVTEIEKEAKQRSDELSSKMSERYNELQQLRGTDVSAQEQIKIKLDDVENVVRGTTEVTTRLQTEVAANSLKVTEIEREAKQRSHELSTQLSERYNEIQQLRATDVSEQEQIKLKLDDLENVVKGSIYSTTRLQAEVINNFSRVTDIEREAKQRSNEMSTRLIEQYNEIQQLRATDVNAQEQIKSKLNDLDTVVRETTEVTTRLLTEVAANSSNITEIERVAKEQSDELNTKLTVQYNEMQELRATDVNAQEQIKSKLDGVENVVKESTVVTTRLQAEVDTNSSRVTEIEREAKQRSDELSTQLSERYNEIQQLRTTDISEQEQIKIKLDDVETIVRGTTVVTTKIQAKVAGNFSKVTDTCLAIEREAKQRSQELSTRLSEVEMKQSEIKASLTEKLENLDYIQRQDLQVKLDQLAADIKTELRRSLNEQEATDQLTSSQLKPQTIPVYNILLLGESGVGKTTFINSFINYIAHETLAEAQKNPITIVIPIKFEITDDNDQAYVIEEGEKDDNESLEDTTQSSIVECRSYLINFDSFYIRLIDSAGVGSTVTETDTNKDQIDKHHEGVEQDKKYVDNVLKYISQFEHLHAIVMVVKSNETRCNTRFELSLKHLLSSFNKSAINNLFFIVTFGDSTRYKSDSAKTILKTLLKNVIESTSGDLLNKNRVYSVDSKGFCYLLAVKRGASFEDDEKMNCEKAWKKSRDECKRLIDYITGQSDQPKLDPHRVTETLSINEARKFINIFEQVIGNILTVIAKNQITLTECLILSSNKADQIAEFEKKLNVKYDDIEIIRMELPQTVCTSTECATTYKVDDEEKTHYANFCCKGCRVAITKRLFCTAFELMSGCCKVCKCHAREHRRIYFTTKIVSKDIKDKDAIVKLMTSATDNKQKIRKFMMYIATQLTKIHTEELIIESAKKIFTRFLKTYPIIPSDGNNGGVKVTILPDEVFAIKKQLLDLEVFGPAIKAAYGIVKQGEEEDDWLARLKSIRLKRK